MLPEINRNDGLSPLARGTPARAMVMARQYRFIPAGAGNTCSSVIPARRCAVYPRWRGEHVFEYPKATAISGLSPLARGTPMELAGEYMRRRFIPAGAGNTSKNPASAGFSSVYPRWRGEHSVRIAVTEIHRGLSPLARGTPTCWRRKEIRMRFIPAGAGNTN